MSTHATNVVLAAAASGTGPQTPVKLVSEKRAFQATLDATVGGSATVVIEVSLNKTQWITLGTITLAGANDTDGFVSDAPWKWVRANITAIGASGETVTVLGAV